jgi:hypothetical protein
MAHSEVITNKPVPGGNHKNHTPAFKIFNYSYECIIASMHLAEITYLEQAGTVTSGNPEVDRVMAQEKVVARLSIQAMAEFHRDGVPFQLCHLADSAVIYRILYDHLKQWTDALNANPYLEIKDTTIEDLHTFDSLAAEIYKYARSQMQESPFHGKFQQFMGRLNSRRGMTRHTDPNAGVTLVTTNDLPATHAPMANQISSTITERKKSWR